MISLKLLIGFMRKEFKQVLRDKRMRILLFVAPIVQLTIFGIAISTTVKNIRLWAAPDSKDFVLQHIYDHAIESQWFLPYSTTQNQDNQDPFDLLRAGKIDVALIAPPGGLTRALGRGTADLQLLIDATNVIQAQSVESYLKIIIDKVVNTDLKITPPDNPLNFVVRVLYNPTLETSYFMVPGVMCILLCIITVILTSSSITREKEMGTFEMLVSSPIKASDVIMGKTIPYVILGLLDTPLILTVAIVLFGVPMRGSIAVLMLAAFAFICSTVAIGTFISTLAKNQQQSILGGFLFLFPAILLSGLMFPLENMPEVLRLLSYLDPLSHFLSLLRNIMLKGGEFSFVAHHIAVLVVMAITFVYISFKRFHTTLS